MQELVYVRVCVWVSERERQGMIAQFQARLYVDFVQAVIFAHSQLIATMRWEGIEEGT